MFLDSRLVLSTPSRPIWRSREGITSRQGDGISCPFNRNTTHDVFPICSTSLDCVPFQTQRHRYLTSITHFQLPKRPKFTCDSFPSILLTNVRSIRNKCDEVKLRVKSENPGISILSESWLDETTESITTFPFQIINLFVVIVCPMEEVSRFTVLRCIKATSVIV